MRSALWIDLMCLIQRADALRVIRQRERAFQRSAYLRKLNRINVLAPTTPTRMLSLMRELRDSTIAHKTTAGEVSKSARKSDNGGS